MNNSLDQEILDTKKRLFETKQIARWQLDSWFERRLESLADNSFFWKRVYVRYYQVFDREYYQGGVKAIARAIQTFRPDATSGEKQKLVIDMVYSLHRFGAMFTEYFLFDFPKLNTCGRLSFITDKMRYVYCEMMNSSDNLPLFDQKNKTYELFKDYCGREVFLVSDETNFELFVDFISRNPMFIKKPIHNGGGRGVEVMSVCNYEHARGMFEEILSDGAFLLEQLMSNHQDIKRIYPHALSTIRMPTVRTKKGIEIFAPCIRLGQGGMTVDNVAAGGMVAVVDTETGIVESPAYDKKGNKYLVHPDTGELIVGFKIPQWDSAKKLAKELSNVIPSNRYVAWDLALTDDGWIMIEGNARGELYLQQCPDRIGKKAWLEELIQS